MKYVVNSINILQQFKVSIQCNKENIDPTLIDSIEILLDSSSIKNKDQNKSLDGILSNLNEVIDSAQSTLDCYINKKEYYAMKLCDVHFIDSTNYESINKLCTTLTECINKIYENVWINKSNTINEHQFDSQPFISNNNEPLLEEINILVNQVLKSVEKLYKKHTDIKTENEDDKLLKYLIIQPLSSDLEDFNLIAINKQFKNVLKSSTGDDVLKSCLPLFEQYILLVQYFITQQTMAYRVLTKMNYLLSTIFTDIVANVSLKMKLFSSN